MRLELRISQRAMRFLLLWRELPDRFELPELQGLVKGYEVRILDGLEFRKLSVEFRGQLAEHLQAGVGRPGVAGFD